MPEISYNPKVSLDPKVYYKTGEASYSRLHIGKPLTDERLEEYELIRKGLKVPGEKSKSSTTRADKRKGKQLAFELTKTLGLLGLP